MKSNEPFLTRQLIEKSFSKKKNFQQKNLKKSNEPLLTRQLMEEPISEMKGVRISMLEEIEDFEIQKYFVSFYILIS